MNNIKKNSEAKKAFKKLISEENHKLNQYKLNIEFNNDFINMYNEIINVLGKRNFNTITIIEYKKLIKDNIDYNLENIKKKRNFKFYNLTYDYKTLGMYDKIISIIGYIDENEIKIYKDLENKNLVYNKDNIETFQSLKKLGVLSSDENIRIINELLYLKEEVNIDNFNILNTVNKTLKAKFEQPFKINSNMNLNDILKKIKTTIYKDKTIFEKIGKVIFNKSSVVKEFNEQDLKDKITNNTNNSIVFE